MATITPKEKDGKIIAYKFRACVGRDENGRQVSRATTWQVPENLSIVRLEKAAQRAAADWEKQARAEYEKDLYDPERVKAREVDRTKTDFTRFVLEEWFPICIDNGERKPKTVSFYHDTTKNIVAHFQGQIVQKITAPDIQKFLIYLRTEKGFAPQNVHHHYRTLNMIFAYAVRQELIVKNPMDKVDRPKLARKKVDALSHDEAAAFFAALREQPLDFRCLLHLLITTGIRRGECIGLKWDDLDEKCGTITIRRNVVYTPQSGVVVGTPKTANSVRVIPVMQSTLSLLLMLKAQRKRENPGTILADSFIFPGEAGIFAARDPNAVTRRVKRFMKAHGLPDLSPHDLRHPYVKPTTKIFSTFLRKVHVGPTQHHFIRTSLQTGAAYPEISFPRSQYRGGLDVSEGAASIETLPPSHVPNGIT